ncbi:MAG: class I SAM-dependent methyltransferase [Lachnospiraceae bacterium]|nr:class I SAM-dependent methyltransferase [Lachnospiraceae bacterium]
MEAYTDFAKVYDLLMDNVPYGAWTERVREELGAVGITDGLVLDLACGSGTVTEALAEAGYDMIGVDLSPEMLNVARQKADESGRDILFLCQDMREFELYGTVRAVVCLCDSLNYLLSPEEVLQCFKLVNNYLDPGGVFIFDFNTVHKYRDCIGDAVIAEQREECSFIWDNRYEDGINDCELKAFVLAEDGRYDAFTEEHLQRGYEEEVMRALLEEAGLRFVKSWWGPEEEGERMFVMARECTKGEKL